MKNIRLILDFIRKENEWKTLVFFIFVSAVLWFFMKMNENYRVRRVWIVRYEDHEKTLPDSLFSDTLSVVLQGIGWHLIKIPSPGYLTFPAEALNDTTLFYKKLKKYLNNSFVYDLELKRNKHKPFIKEVKIKTILHTPNQSGLRLKKLKIFPSTLWIWGAKAEIDTLSEIETIPVTVHNRSGEIVVKPNLPGGVKTVFEKIRVDYQLSEYLSGEVRVKPELPDSLRGKLILFPPQVNIYYEQWIDKDSKKNQWKIGVAFDPGQKLLLPVVKKKPDNVFHYKILPEKLDYLIENEK